MGWIFCRVVKLPRATSHPIFHHFIPSTTGNQITEMLPAPPAPGSCPPAWQDSWVLCAHSGAGWLRPHWAPGCDCAVGEIPRLGGQRGAEGGPAPLSRDTGVCTGGLSRDKDPWARCSRGSGRGGGPGRGGLRVCGCSDPPVHLSPHSGLTCARDPCVNGGTCLAHPDGSRSCLWGLRRGGGAWHVGPTVNMADEVTYRPLVPNMAARPWPVPAQTPLFLAAREGSADVARLLLRHRASRQLPDELGHLPRDAALARAHHDLLRLLDDPRLGPPPCRPPRLRPLPEEPEPPAPCLAPRRPWAPGQSDGAPVQ
ncbi:hypothetical protein KIL84_004100 [Mauremys mutica]|uniref:Uncharacterized protein n=1 Tax=Mauremys mutica TaxID=74926 RepID=A0A9D4B5Z1_9SAUR|nr:hypothetical protein KIL84_004100 [Mauremys mutica]